MKKILITLLNIIVIGVSAFIVVYSLFFEEIPDYRRLIKSVVILVGYLYGIARVTGNPFGQNYRMYEEQYKDIVEGAFEEDKKSYRKLLEATVYYNRDQFKKAHNVLDGLINKCMRAKDYTAVYTFKALCYGEENKNEQSIAAYEKVLQYDMANSRAWSNMGLRYMAIGKMQEAFDAYSNAIKYEPTNAMAYTNMASFLVKAGEPKAGLGYALKALELNSSVYQAMSWAATAYKMLGDDANAEKYCKMYGVNGGNAKDLRRLLETM